MKKQFEKFLATAWGLEVWSGDKIIFRSKKSGVTGLLDFIRKYDRQYKRTVIFDKIVGQGVALLAAYLKVKMVYGRTGSKLAAKKLKKFKIKFYFQKAVPNILNKNKTDLCPFEKLSLNKKPEDFYKRLIRRGFTSTK